MCGNGICQKCGVNQVPKKPLGRRGPQGKHCETCRKRVVGEINHVMCQGCGESFQSQVERGRPRKWCLKCRNANGRVVRFTERTKVVASCEFCRTAIFGHKRRFCNAECREGARAERYLAKNAAKPKICESCSESFMGRGDLTKCRSCNQRKLREHNCDYCGTLFWPRSIKCVSYCSRECAFADIAHRNKLREIANRTGLGYFVQTRSHWHTCRHCSTLFYTPTPTIASVCSSRCSAIASGRVLPPDARRKCVDCGDEFSKYLNGMMGKRCEVCREERRKAEKKKWRALRRVRKRCRYYGGRYVPFDRLMVLERDAWLCQICGKKTDPTLDSTHDDFPELDHVIPLSRGGDHTPENTQCLCRKCNGFKHTKLPSEMGLEVLF